MFADGSLCTYSPDSDGESHTTDRLNISAVSKFHSSHAIRHGRSTRFSSILGNCSERIVTVPPLTFQSSVCSCNSLHFSAGFDDENHATHRHYTPAVSKLVTAAKQSATADLRISLQSSATVWNNSSPFSTVLCSLEFATCCFVFEG
jgi:hypothetical protein